MDVHVELLASPFCMADRDNKTIRGICRELGADYRMLNMWDIDDGMAGIPEHVASLVKEYPILSNASAILCSISLTRGGET